MAVTIAQFLEITDRLGAQWEILRDASIAANADGGTGKKFLGYVFDSGDQAFISRMARGANFADNELVGGTYLKATMQWYHSLIWGLDQWLKNDAGYSTIEDYLEAESAKVSSLFDALWLMVMKRNIDSVYVEDREVAL